MCSVASLNHAASRLSSGPATPACVARQPIKVNARRLLPRSCCLPNVFAALRPNAPSRVTLAAHAPKCVGYSQINSPHNVSDEAGSALSSSGTFHGCCGSPREDCQGSRGKAPSAAFGVLGSFVEPP